MPITGKRPQNQTWPILLLRTVQMRCSVCFAIDVATEVRPKGWSRLQQMTGWPDVAATVALVLGF